MSCPWLNHFLRSFSDVLFCRGDSLQHAMNFINTSSFLCGTVIICGFSFVFVCVLSRGGSEILCRSGRWSSRDRDPNISFLPKNGWNWELFGLHRGVHQGHPLDQPMLSIKKLIFPLDLDYPHSFHFDISTFQASNWQKLWSPRADVKSVKWQKINARTTTVCFISTNLVEKFVPTRK